LTDILDSAAVQAAALRVADRVEGLRDTLNELDAAMGDGDLGISASKAAPAIREYVTANPPGDDIGKFLSGLGMAVNRVASSTMGTLTATALMRAGKEAKGLSALDAGAGAHVVRRRHRDAGARAGGDKIILDALHPAAGVFLHYGRWGDPRGCGSGDARLAPGAMYGAAP
jgi:hypothetical protein